MKTLVVVENYRDDLLTSHDAIARVVGVLMHLDF